MRNLLMRMVSKRRVIELIVKQTIITRYNDVTPAMLLLLYFYRSCGAQRAI